MTSEEKRSGLDLGALEADGDLCTVNHSETSHQTHLGHGAPSENARVKMYHSFGECDTLTVNKQLHLMIIISAINIFSFHM